MCLESHRQPKGVWMKGCEGWRAGAVQGGGGTETWRRCSDVPHLLGEKPRPLKVP